LFCSHRTILCLLLALATLVSSINADTGSQHHAETGAGIRRALRRNRDNRHSENTHSKSSPLTKVANEVILVDEEADISVSGGGAGAAQFSASASGELGGNVETSSDLLVESDVVGDSNTDSSAGTSVTSSIETEEETDEMDSNVSKTGKSESTVTGDTAIASSARNGETGGRAETKTDLSAGDGAGGYTNIAEESSTSTSIQATGTGSSATSSATTSTSASATTESPP
jgi:hypothetical protein